MDECGNCGQNESNPTYWDWHDSQNCWVNTQKPT